MDSRWVLDFQFAVIFFIISSSSISLSEQVAAKNVSNSTTSGSRREWKALMDFGWPSKNSTTHHCQWSGLSCDDDGHVTEISLEGDTTEDMGDKCLLKELNIGDLIDMDQFLDDVPELAPEGDLGVDTSIVVPLPQDLAMEILPDENSSPARAEAPRSDLPLTLASASKPLQKIIVRNKAGGGAALVPGTKGVGKKRPASEDKPIGKKSSASDEKRESRKKLSHDRSKEGSSSPRVPSSGRLPSPSASPGLVNTSAFPLSQWSESAGLTNLSPIKSLEFVQNGLSTPFDKGQISSHSLLQRRSSMCQYLLKSLAILSYELSPQSDDPHAQMLQQEKEMQALRNLSSRNAANLEKSAKVIQELKGEVQALDKEKGKHEATIGCLGTRIEDLQAELEKEKMAGDRRAEEARLLGFQEGRAAGIKDGIRRFFATNEGQLLLHKLKDGLCEGYSRSAELFNLLQSEIFHYSMDAYVQGLRYGMTLKEGAKPEPSKMKLKPARPPLRWEAAAAEPIDSIPWWESCLLPIMTDFLRDLEVHTNLSLVGEADVFLSLPPDLTEMRHTAPSSSSSGDQASGAPPS